MILVTIQLLPGGDASRAKTIGTIKLANVSGLAPTSNYVCLVETTGCPELKIDPVNRKLVVKAHHRSAGVLRLLARVLNLSVHGEDL